MVEAKKTFGATLVVSVGSGQNMGSIVAAMQCWEYNYGGVGSDMVEVATRAES